jgi:hypothetical protein
MTYWIREVVETGGTVRAVQASWGRAPLRVSIVGVAANIQVHRVTGESAEGPPLELSLSRSVPAPDRPLENTSLSFEVTGDKATDVDGIRAAMHGSLLSRVKISGQWTDEEATYTATLTCSPIEAPLLCDFAVLFPAPATLAPPEDIEIFQAVGEWATDSGDPETLPDAAATFTLSRPMLDRLVPDWKTAILPYRPCVIRAKYPNSETWTTLFNGFLTPDSASRQRWNEFEMPIEARGHLMKVMQPYALIDEKYAPLSLWLTPDRAAIYGAEAVKRLLEIERGTAAVENFNGDGNPLRYFGPGHYPLLGGNDNYFQATNELQDSNLRLPPPFGQYLNDWINTLAKYDYAVWFHDGDNFYYGRIVEFLSDRGLTVWTVTEEAPPSYLNTSQWPVLTSLSMSGALEGAYNEVRVWSPPAPGMEDYQPGLLMGRAGDGDEDSVDPLSVAQSGRRTLLLKPDFAAMKTTVDAAYVQDLAYWTWREFKGKPPRRLDLEFDTGFLGPRWGEILALPGGFDGPRAGGVAEEWRILQVKHKGSRTGAQSRFRTTLTTRSLSESGQ